MPRRTAIGLAPALTFWRPSATIAWPRTMAVVVPSPATSSVLVATSLRSCAPMFSNGSSSSISLAIVTPSLVIVGEPYFLSRTTLRPFGPIVTLTASARWSMPRLRLRRAISSKRSCLAMTLLSFQGECRRGCAGRDRRVRASKPDLPSALDHRENVLVADDQQVLAVKLEVRAGVLRVEDLVARAQVDLLALAVIEDPARANRDHGSLLRLLLGGVRDHDPTLCHLFAGHGPNDHAVTQRTEFLRGWRVDGRLGRLRGTDGFDSLDGGHRILPPLRSFYGS